MLVLMRRHFVVHILVACWIATGAGVAVADQQDAGLRWLEARAAVGDVSATTELAARLELGIGVAPDPVRAMAMFCRAAGFGGRVATLHIVGWLLTDDGPDYDPGLAAAWLRRLQRADRGVPERAIGKVPECPTQAVQALHASADALNRIIDQFAFEQGVDAALVRAVIAIESGFRGDAVSSAGAVGLMQLMPATARRFGVTDRIDLGQNLKAGTTLLGLLLRRYNGDVARALAAYHAGEATVDRCQCVPQIPQTTEYVRRVTTLYAARQPMGTTRNINEDVRHRLPRP
jgi:hypothetical protein